MENEETRKHAQTMLESAIASLATSMLDACPSPGRNRLAREMMHSACRVLLGLPTNTETPREMTIQNLIVLTKEEASKLLRTASPKEIEELALMYRVSWGLLEVPGKSTDNC